MTTLPTIFGAIVSDAAAIGSAAAGHAIAAAAAIGAAAEVALDRWKKSRADAARDILFEHLRAGEIFDVEVKRKDEAAGIIYQYQRAASEGRARLNLRLLAQVIVGQARTGNLSADEFRRFADILEDLSRDEIVLIGTLYRFSKWPIPEGEKDPGSVAWRGTLDGLKAEVWSADRIEATASRAQRSGLVIARSGWDSIIYSVSPLMIELSETVDFDDAVRRESGLAS